MREPRKKDGGGYTPLVVTDRVRNDMKRKEIKSSPWGHNGTATGPRGAAESGNGHEEGGKNPNGTRAPPRRASVDGADQSHKAG
jgi:hypothetical protein